MTYTVVNPHACCKFADSNGQSLEDVNADARPPQYPHMLNSQSVDAHKHTHIMRNITVLRLAYPLWCRGY